MEPDAKASPALDEALAALVGSGFCGLVWLDGTLTVVDCVGDLVGFVKRGLSVGEALIPLFGSEDDIRALTSDPRRRFDLSNVRIMGATADSPRLNFSAQWLPRQSLYLVFVMLATGQAEIEAELQNQSRRRALAEAKAIEQSRALERANAELMRANSQLDEYANIIAHDLKSPMRAVRYVADDIARALADKDSDAARARLADLQQQARRMSHMLSDLLLYARIGPNDEEAFSDVDTRALVEAIVASLPRPRGFRIELVGQWPLMHTIEPALDLVLRNLIDNAIKHHDLDDGCVTVQGRLVEGGLEIMVADDGPGIDPRYHEAIFKPFRRLDMQPRDETRSSGIGLSLVKKTVESNGAALELISSPAERRGTSFLLRWKGTLLE